MEDRNVAEPARIRITLIDVCRATVRVGSSTHLEFHPNAIIPIPRRFRMARWVQLDGCGSLQPLPAALRADTPRESRPTIRAAEAVERRPLPSVIAVWRDPATGFASLRVNEAQLEAHNLAVGFRLHDVCRYEQDRGWEAVSGVRKGIDTRIEPRSPDQRQYGDRPVVELPRAVGLFWLRWAEWKGEARGELRSMRSTGYTSRATLVASGPILCNDIETGEPPAGMVAACVPFADRAEALFVPMPPGACTR